MSSIPTPIGRRYPENRTLTAGTSTSDRLLEELRALRAEARAQRGELTQLRRLFDHFAGTYLNARFPYGKATDRWTR